jgi:hypothetical protein
MTTETQEKTFALRRAMFATITALMWIPGLSAMWVHDKITGYKSCGKEESIGRTLAWGFFPITIAGYVWDYPSRLQRRNRIVEIDNNLDSLRRELQSQQDMLTTTIENIVRLDHAKDRGEPVSINYDSQIALEQMQRETIDNTKQTINNLEKERAQLVRNNA